MGNVTNVEKFAYGGYRLRDDPDKDKAKAPASEAEKLLIDHCFLNYFETNPYPVTTNRQARQAIEWIKDRKHATYAQMAHVLGLDFERFELWRLDKTMSYDDEEIELLVMEAINAPKTKSFSQ